MERKLQGPGRTYRNKKVHDYGIDDADNDEPLECEPVFNVRGHYACSVMFHRHDELCALNKPTIFLRRL